MFFSISKQNFDDRFVNRHNVSNFYISVDNGWNKKFVNNATVFFKGYCDSCLLDSIIEDYTNNYIPAHHGNFCIIVVKNDSLQISHNIGRSFPLCVYNNDIVTNFVDNEVEWHKENVWGNSLVKYKNNEIKIIPYKALSNIDFLDTMSETDCLNTIYEILNEKTSLFLSTSLPIKSYLTGGVDTMMSYAVAANKIGSKIDFVTAEHFDLTTFTLKNYQKISDTFWGYRQIHHWKTPTILISGAFGDLMFMRSASVAALWCAWNDVNILDELNNLDYSYHKKYFLRHENQETFSKVWDNRKKIQKYSYNQLCEQIFNIAANDHQHWHIENTLTWTPLKDLRILHAMLRLPKEILLQQILHGSFDRKLIAKFNPELNNYICTHKNYNQYHNLLKYNAYMNEINK